MKLVTRPAFLTRVLVALSVLSLVACGGGSAPATSAPSASGGSAPPAAASPAAPPSGAAPSGSAPATATRAAPASTAAAASAPAPSGPATKVTIGYIPILAFAPFFVAVDKGYFKDAGVDVAFEPLTGGADILVQTAAGHFDVGGGGFGAAVLNAAQRGVGFKVVAPLHLESPPVLSPIVVRKAAVDSGAIKSLRDLKGKKVAINTKGAAAEYWVELAMRTVGLSIDDLDIVVVAPADQPAALEKGAIEASLIYEPLATLTVQKGIGVKLAEDFVTNGQPTVTFFNQEFLKNKPAAAAAVMAGFLRGARDLVDGGFKRDENVKIIEKYTKVPADVIRAANAPYYEPNGKLNLEDLQRQQAFYIKQGATTYKDPIDVKTMVDTSFAERAVQKLGEYKKQ